MNAEPTTRQTSFPEPERPTASSSTDEARSPLGTSFATTIGGAESHDRLFARMAELTSPASHADDVLFNRIAELVASAPAPGDSAFGGTVPATSPESRSTARRDALRRSIASGARL